MHTTSVKPAQLLMEFLEKEQAKIGRHISSEEFARDLEEEERARRADAERLSLPELSRYPSTDMKDPREHLSSMHSLAERTTPKVKESPHGRTESRIHTQRHATALSKAKWKAAGSLSLTDPIALDNVLAQLHLSMEARQSCHDAQSDEGHISLQDLQTILDRVAQDGEGGQSQGKVSALDVQTLLASLHQDRKCIAESLSHIKIKRKGTYDLNELRQVLHRIGTEAADEALTHGKPELSPNSSLTDPAATEETGAASEAGKTASQVESLAESPLPSFLEESGLRDAKGAGPPPSLSYLTARMQESQALAPDASDPIGSLNLHQALGKEGFQTALRGQEGPSGRESPLGVTESSAQAANIFRDAHPFLLQSNAKEGTMPQASTISAERDGASGESPVNGSQVLGATSPAQRATPDGFRQGITGSAVTLSLSELLAEVESGGQIVVKSHHYEADSAGHESTTGEGGRPPVSQAAPASEPVRQASTARDGDSQPHKDHGGAEGMRQRAESPPGGFGMELREESGNSSGRLRKQSELWMTPSSISQGNSPGKHPTASSDSPEGAVGTAEKQTGSLLTNAYDQKGAPVLNREGVFGLPSQVPSPTAKNTQTLTLTASSWPAELTEHIKELRGRQPKYLTLELEPQHLGRLLLRVETDRNRVTTSIFTESEEARMLLNRGISRLRQQLEANGLTLGHFLVNVDHGRGESLLFQRRIHHAARQRTADSQKRHSEAAGGVSELNAADRIVSLFA